MQAKKWLLRIPLILVGSILAGIGIDSGYALVRGQRYQTFSTPTPLLPGETLVIGIHGGRNRWDDARRSIRRVALQLRNRNLPGVHVETVENNRRSIALELVRNAFDRNRDGKLDPGEAASARVVLYGQSLGGAAVVKLARELKALGVPVLLTVQIDSVGFNDSHLPDNVRAAANLYEDSGWLIHGEPKIRADDPSRTAVLGNIRFNYRMKQIDLSDLPWYRKAFRVDHIRVEHDPDVWAKVEELLLAELHKPAFSLLASQKNQAKKLQAVRFETDAGVIDVEVDGSYAPGTVANFLKYVDGGFYGGGRFHRAVKINPDNQPDKRIKIEVIQAGPNPDRPKNEFPPIPLERTSVTGLRHVDGTISMARDGPDSATSDFFVCIGNQPELDFGGKRNPDGQGFAAFGRVVKGMDVVRKIQNSTAEGQRLTPPVKIISAKRLN